MIPVRALALVLALAAATPAPAQEGAVSVTLTSPQEPTLAAALERHLTDCWAPALPSALPAGQGPWGIEGTLILAPGAARLDLARDFRLRGLALGQAGAILTGAAAALEGCPVAGLPALAAAIPPDGLGFALTVEVIPPMTADQEAALMALMAEGDSLAPADWSPADRHAFRQAVAGCWNVDAGSEGARVTLTVAFSLDRDGKVVGNEVRLVGADGGSQAAIDAAFHSARRAVLRCQSTTGYDLPDAAYDQWREIALTFAPDGMRLR